MKFTWIKFSYFYLALYSLGIFSLGLGVALFAEANLGVAPWDTAILNFQSLMASYGIQITLGTSSLMHTAILLILVLALGQRLESLFAIIPMVAISLSIDFWSVLVLPALIHEPLNLTLQIIFFISATLLMTWGLATIIISGFPPNVYDDVHLTILRVFKIKSFTIGRWIIEFMGVFLGLIYALIQGEGLGSITILSFALAIAFGSLITFFVNLYRKNELMNRHLK